MAPSSPLCRKLNIRASAQQQVLQPPPASAIPCSLLWVTQAPDAQPHAWSLSAQQKSALVLLPRHFCGHRGRDGICSYTHLCLCAVWKTSTPCSSSFWLKRSWIWLQPKTHLVLAVQTGYLKNHREKVFGLRMLLWLKKILKVLKCLFKQNNFHLNAGTISTIWF